MSTRVPLLVVIIVALTLSVACGGGSIGAVKNPKKFTIGGTVSGLASGASVALLDNGGDSLTVSANGSFTFATALAAGASYNVTVGTQPTGETCTVSNGTGPANANVTSVSVTCAATTFTVSVNVSGLTGTGLVLQDNGADNLSVSSDGTFPFATALASGSAYAVTILTQPSGQTCTLGSNASGTISGDVTVNVTCPAVIPTFTLSATVTGLTGGTLVLQDDQTQQLSFTSNTTQTFSNSYLSGATYSVIVLTQPAGQTCTLSSNASGTITANVTVTATCTANPTFTLSVTTTGLTAGTLIVQDDQAKTLSFSSSTTQSFSNTYASGATYSVTITQQPTGFTCTLGSNATGTITANTTVTATCTAAPTFTLSVMTTGLTAGTLIVQDDATQTLSFSSSTTQTFSNTYTSGASYTVGITQQPTGFTCTLGSNATGTITANTTVTATCIANPTFTLSVTTTGLTAGTLIVQDDQAQTLSFSSSTTQAFSNTYLSGATYSVSITQQPTGFSCTLGSNASGIITANTTVTATCTSTAALTLSVTTTGLSAGTLIVQDDQSQTLSFSSNTTKTFSNTYASGASYSVTITQQPTGETCSLSSDSTGTITANTTVTASCTSSAASGEWAWVTGADVVAVGGIYPTQTPATPGSRYGAYTWTDSAGKFWMYGGFGYDTNGPKVTDTTTKGAESVLGDLWNYDGTKWNFKAGQAQNGQCFAFPTLGQTGTPSGRSHGVSWIDSQGNMWMFGGYEAYMTDITQCPNALVADAFNDFWEYKPSANTWTYIGGSSNPKQQGTYNSIGQTGTPGARYYSTGASDANGNFWMFGGYGFDKSSGEYGWLNDLWKFDGTNWTWVSGSNKENQKGVYTGTMVPGSRYGAASWFDSAGNFWIFGGDGWDSTGLASAIGNMNDLWEFNVSTSKWTFVGGSKTVAGAVGVYGAQGVGASGNTPGGRVWPTTWVAPNGDVWLLGGVYSPRDNYYDDLWKYDGTNWIWVDPAMPTDGSQFINDLGNYPASAGGGPQPGIFPGSRQGGAAWTDSNGNLWLFGGKGLGTLPVGTCTTNCNPHEGFDSLQDLWEFQP